MWDVFCHFYGHFIFIGTLTDLPLVAVAGFWQMYLLELCIAAINWKQLFQYWNQLYTK